MQTQRNINERRYIQLGLKIAYYRNLNGLSQEQLAEKVDLTPNHLSKIERRSLAAPISLKSLFAIADALHVPPAKFFEFDE